jgi:dUTP pyrophosphatase
MNNTDLNYLKEQAEMVNKYLDENYDDEMFQTILDETGLDIKELENSMMSYSPQLSLKYKKLNPEAKDPFYNYPSDSGFDLYATQTVYITKFGRALVPTGLSFDIKDGYEIQVRSKSGLAINQGLMVLNSPGTVDNGYTGEVQVIIFNTNDFAYTIEKGTKIAQAVLCPVVNGKWVELEETMEEINKDRNENGFGSTGI